MLFFGGVGGGVDLWGFGGLLMGFCAFWFSCTMSSDCRLEMKCPVFGPPGGTGALVAFVICQSLEQGLVCIHA